MATASAHASILAFTSKAQVLEKRDDVLGGGIVETEFVLNRDESLRGGRAEDPP